MEASSIINRVSLYLFVLRENFIFPEKSFFDKIFLCIVMPMIIIRRNTLADLPVGANKINFFLIFHNSLIIFEIINVFPVPAYPLKYIFHRIFFFQ